MPTVHDDEDLDIYSEDSFSDRSEDELNARETPQFSRPRSAKARPGSARKAPPNKPPSPYLNKSAGFKSAKSRPRSADPNNKTAKELWLQGLRQGGGRSSNYVGPVKTNAWGSCSDYLKETVLGMPPKRHSRGSTMDGPMMRTAKGVPTYKPQEDMYDDIIDLKKSVNLLKSENERLKARNRRLEDDHVKKERQIEQLLDPSQANLRATLSSKQPDTAAKVSSLKQKSLKLEMSLKEKEAELTKLQTDLKTTKMEEMRVAMESFYQEVLRLRHHIKSGTAGRAGKAGQEANNPAKMKALNGTILRLTESNQRLQSENKLLKQDLDRALDAGSPDAPQGKKRKGKKKDYEDMNRRELLVSIADLEQKLDKVEGRGNLSNRRQGNIPGKISLSGSLADRLDQLDKRETGLLEEKSSLEKDVKRLKEEKSKLRQKVEDSEFEILALQKQVDKLRDELKETNSRSRSSRETTPRETPRSGSLKRHSSQDSLNKTITPRSGSLRRHPSQESLQSQRSHRSQASQRSKAMSKAGSTSSLRRRQKEEEEWVRERDRKLEELRQNRSAKSIQKNWRAHRQRVKEKELDSSDLEDAAVTIQSAVRGHKTRKHQMNHLDSDSSVQNALDSDDDSDMDDAAMTIQSAVRGHWTRKDQLSRNDTESEYGSERGLARSRSRSGSRGSRAGSIKQNGGGVFSDDSDSDSVVIGGSQSGRSIRSTSSQNNRPVSARRGRESTNYTNAIRGNERFSVTRDTKPARSRNRDGRDADDVPTSVAKYKSPALSNGHSVSSRHSVASHHSEVSRHSGTSRQSLGSQRSAHRDGSPVESHHSARRASSTAGSHRSARRDSSPAESHRSARRDSSPAGSHRSARRDSSPAESHRSARHDSSLAESHRSARHDSSPVGSHRSAHRGSSPAESHRSARRESSPAESHHSARHDGSTAGSHHLTRRDKSPAESHHSARRDGSTIGSHRSTHREESPTGSHHSARRNGSISGSHQYSRRGTSPVGSHRSSRRDSSPAEEIAEDEDIPVAVDSDDDDLVM